MSIFVKRKPKTLKYIKNSLNQEEADFSEKKQNTNSNNLPVPAYIAGFSAVKEKLYLNGIPYAPSSSGMNIQKDSNGMLEMKILSEFYIPKTFLLTEGKSNEKPDKETIPRKQRKKQMSFSEGTKLFYEKHTEFVKENGRNPGITELSDYSKIKYTTLLNILKPLERLGKINLVTKNDDMRKKEIEVMGDVNTNDLPDMGPAEYRSCKRRDKISMHENKENGDAIKIDSLLENSYVRDYMAELFKFNGNDPQDTCGKAEKIMSLLNSQSQTDEKVSEITGILLNDVRRHLLRLYENSMVSLERIVDTRTNWRTDMWKINEKEIEALRNSCIANMREKAHYLKEEYELRRKENENGRYFCRADESHFSAGFGEIEFISPEGNAFSCPKCGSQLSYKSCDELAESADPRISELEKGIREIEQIKI